MKNDNVLMYLRKSRSDDPNKTVEEVLSKHESMLQEFALHEYGAMIPEERIYREVVSGETISNRPVIQIILNLLETGTITAVLVIEPQRLTRGDLADCGHIVNAFRYTNTHVVTPTKEYDLQNEYDRKFFEMELMRGNDYLEYTKKVLNRGRLNSVKQGNFIGGRAPYGYRKVTVGTGKNSYPSLEPDPERSNHVAMIYEWYVQGLSLRQICRNLDDAGIVPTYSASWSTSSLQSILVNPVYIGKIRWGIMQLDRKMVDGELVPYRRHRNDSDVIYVDGKHEPIISNELFEAALQRYHNMPRNNASLSLQNEFSCILYCQCGKLMERQVVIRRSKGQERRQVYFRCSGRPACGAKVLIPSMLYERITGVLESSIKDFEVKLSSGVDDSAATYKKMLAKKKAELDALMQKDLRQKDAYEDGVYTKEEYATRNAKLQEQIVNARSILDKMIVEKPKTINYSDRIVKFTAVLDALNDDSISPEQKNRLFRKVFDKIVYRPSMDKNTRGRGLNSVFDLDIFFSAF